MASKTEALKATTSVKRCPKCSETKPRADFYRNRATKDGLQPACKPCQRAAANSWHRANKERGRANREAWRARNPDKYDAKQRRLIERRKEVRNRLTRAARYFAGRPGWERVVFHVLASDSQVQGYCYLSPPLEELYLKYTEDAWNV